MGSAFFRIIPHPVHQSDSSEERDLYRYLISYVSSSQPQYIALDTNSHAYLVTNEDLATRFPSSEAAHKRLDQALQCHELAAVPG